VDLEENLLLRFLLESVDVAVETSFLTELYSHYFRSHSQYHIAKADTVYEKIGPVELQGPALGSSADSNTGAHFDQMGRMDGPTR
jgi:hypothetical protein